MNTSKFEYLKNINKIALSPGHGSVDPGAVNGKFHEAKQVRTITNKIADNLRAKGIEVDVMSDSLLEGLKTGNAVLQKQINWVNNNYKTLNSAWAIQIHRDSASGLDFDDASTRWGVYFYKDSSKSKEIADFIRQIFFNEGKNKNSWARHHFVTQGTGQFGLGWLQKTIPVSHLFEMGFMQGDNSDEHLNRLAEVATKAIYEAFTGLPYGPNTVPSIPLPIPVPGIHIDPNISIEGVSVASKEQMVAYLNQVNPKPKINCTVEELVDLFLEEGKLENIRGDIAFAQSLHETGNFNYGNLVLPEQNNFAGIGATNSSARGKGAWFDLPRTGVKAQIQHLKAYANNLPLNSENVDPRFNLVNPRGKAPRWIDLNGKWAVPGTTYGQMILKVYSNIINMSTPPKSQVEKFALDQRQIDEFMRIFGEKEGDRKIKNLPYTDEQIAYLRGIILNNGDIAMVVRNILEDMKRMREEIQDLKNKIN